MTRPAYSDLLSTASMLLATGASPGEAAEMVKEVTRKYHWPSDVKGWDRCLEEIVSEFGLWEILLAAVAPHVRANSPLKWPQVFTALGRTLGKPADRFAFLHRVLTDHHKRKARTFLRICLDNLVHAGIHPASLAICSYPTLPTNGVRGLLQIMGKKSGITPLGYDPESWKRDISGWSLEVFPSGLDGLVSSEPTTVFHRPGAPTVSQKEASLGNRMTLGSNFKVQNAKKIKCLGEDIHVYGDLELIGLDGLLHLGKRIRIEGNLIINHCPAMLGLPEDLFVGGFVYVGTPKAGFQWGSGFPSEKRSSTSWNMPAYTKWEVPQSLEILQGG